jgi:hypothetical protein
MRAAVESAITANFIISPFGRAPATNELKPQPFHECLFIIVRSGPSPLIVRTPSKKPPPVETVTAS